jgi:proteasome lid subunit RPN8/RPN11
MTTEEIYLPRKLTQQLLHHAQTVPEQEVCGLISAKNNLPCHCYPINNRAEQPKDKFLLDQPQQIAAMVTMREQGEELFAIYHSHPTAPAAPSPTDIALADYPGVLHFIISLNTKGVLELRGFKIIGQAVEEIVLRLVE